jgi:hypothetical protein
VKVTDPLSAAPLAGEVSVAVGGLSGVAPACETEKVSPAREMDPLRPLVEVLAATAKETLPLPLPLLGAFNVIQL